MEAKKMEMEAEVEGVMGATYEGMGDQADPLYYTEEKILKQKININGEEVKLKLSRTHIKVYSGVATTTEDFKEYTPVELYDYLTAQNNPVGYEGYGGGIKFNADFERNFKTKKEMWASRGKLLSKWKNEFQMVAGCKPEDIAISDSSGKKGREWRVSFHMIEINGPIYEDGLAVKNKAELIAGADMSIYRAHNSRQLFRLPLCSKEGENRPFKRIDKPLTRENFHECLVSHIGDYEITQRPERAGTAEDETIKKAVEALENYASDVAKVCGGVMSVKTTEDGKTFVYFKRTAPLWCSFHNRTHDKDNSYYVLINPDGTAFLGCARPPEHSAETPLRPLFKQTKYDKQAQILEKLLKNPKRHLANIRKEFEKMADIVKVSFKKWLNDSVEAGYFMKTYNKERLLLGIRSNLGTGKSLSLIEAIKENIKNNPDGNILIITPRRVLSTQMEKELADLGFINYLNRETEKITEKRVICQLDSLHYVAWHNEGRPLNSGLIVLDEGDQSIKHLNATTYKNNKCANMNYARLRQFLKQSEKVICLSGNLRATHMEKWRAMTGNIKTIIIINDASKFHEPFNIKLALNDSQILAKASEDLKAGRRVYLASNKNIKDIKKFYETLMKAKPDIKGILITTETMTEPAVKRAVDDIRNEWQEYNLIVVSPCIQSGVNFDIEGYFDNIYAIFSNGSNSSEDAFQMLRRVRYPTNRDIFINITMHGGNRPTNPADILKSMSTAPENILKGMADKVFDEELDYITGLPTYNKHPYPRLIAELEAEANKDKNQYTENFIKWAICHGWNVEQIQPDEQNTEDIKEEYKAVSIEVDKNYAKELFEAELITEDEAEKLRKRMERHPEKTTREDVVKLQKHNILKLYRLPEPPNNAEWYEIFTEQRVKEGFKNSRYFYDIVPVEDYMASKWAGWEKGLERIKKNEYRTTEGQLEEAIKESGTRDKLIFDMTKNNYKYEAISLMCDTMKEMGFKSLHDDEPRTRQEILNGFKRIQNGVFSDPERAIITLRKDRKKIESLMNLKPDNKNYFKQMMEFINGPLKNMFNVTIKATNNKRTHYKLYGGVDKVYSRVKNDYFPLIGWTTSEREIEEPIEEEPSEPEIVTIGDKEAFLRGLKY